MPRICGFWCALAIVVANLLGAPVIGTVRAEAPDWVEPRALNIVDIAGQVPDEVLRGNIVSFGFGGISRFVSSERVGDRLRIRVRLNPRVFRNTNGSYSITFLLLSQKPHEDHMGSSMPESWLRLYDGATDITDCISFGKLTRADLSFPRAGSGAPDRYQDYWINSPFTIEADGLRLPANYGGTLTFEDTKPYDELQAVFTVRPTNRPAVTYLGEEEFTYRSYIGVGDVGKFNRLMLQLRNKYKDRHDMFPLNVPKGANYVMFTYEPMPFDVYTESAGGGEDLNLLRPIGGTLRMTPDGAMLSQDLSHGGAFPLNVWWQEADQVKGEPPPPYLSVFRSTVKYVKSPEFTVLPGTPYKPCYLTGSCNDKDLKDIYDRNASLRIIYLKVVPIPGQLTLVPLRMAHFWTPQSMALAADLQQAQYHMYLPTIGIARNTPLRPAGWFDPISHRMVGYEP